MFGNINFLFFWCGTTVEILEDEEALAVRFGFMSSQKPGRRKKQHGSE